MPCIGEPVLQCFSNNLINDYDSFPMPSLPCFDYQKRYCLDYRPRIVNEVIQGTDESKVKIRLNFLRTNASQAVTVVANLGQRTMSIPINEGIISAQSNHGKNFRPGSDLLIPSKKACSFWELKVPSFFLR